MYSANRKNLAVSGKDKKVWDAWMFWWGGTAVSRIKISSAVTSNSYLLQLPSCSTTIPTPNLPSLSTDIVDTGVSGIYSNPSAPCAKINPTAMHIFIGTAGGTPHQSSSSCDLILTYLPVSSGHIMPNFHHNLMGIRQLCDHNCRVIFVKTAVAVFRKNNAILLRGWY